MNLFYQPHISEGIHHLDPEESRHAVRVLRKSKGDSIYITDGKGFFYDALITKADSSSCQFEITSKNPERSKGYKIHIAIAPTKNPERIEWFLEKAIEIGIDEVTFIETKNTERVYLKDERLKRLAISAMKQSLKAHMPKLNGLVPIKDFLVKASEGDKFIAFVDSANPVLLKDCISNIFESSLVLIGPEGDFTQDELNMALQNGYRKVSLGESRLRTETAGVVACHILNLFHS